jgi:hypothetical protein
MNESSAGQTRRDLVLGSAGALAAALVGLVLVGFSTKMAVAAVAALLLGALIARAPTAIFGVCLLVLSYEPNYIGGIGVLGDPSLQKGIVYFGALGMALRRGIRPRFLIVPAAYVIQAILAELNGKATAGLDLTQILSSFVTLTAGWVALAVDWDFERDVVYLKILSALPVLCVVLGAVLQVAGLYAVFSGGRLEGASGPAQLALTAFIAAGTASVCYRLVRWRWAPLFFVVDALILALTVSRGAAIALAIAMAWPAIRFAFSPAEDQRWFRSRAARIAILAGAIAIVAALVIPPLLARDSSGTFVQGQGVVVDKTSGRSKAWSEFYAIARQSPLFGHGLGAGPITKITQQGFLAQHNEFLRLFLEGGYIGGGLVLLAMVIVIATCIVLSPSWVRFDLAGLAIGFAVLSYTDNTLTSDNLQVPFCLVFGIVASVGYRSLQARRSGALVDQLLAVDIT